MTREELLGIRTDVVALLARIDVALDTTVAIPTALGGVDPQLVADLKRDEGLRLEAYPDPLTNADPWTIGYGHTGRDVKQGTIWTREQADQVLLADIAEHTAKLIAALPWVAMLDPARRRVLQNMAFNLGVGVPGGTHGLLSFKNTLAMIQRGDYANAADALLRSLWAAQVGKRAQRLAATMRTGV